MAMPVTANARTVEERRGGREGWTPTLSPPTLHSSAVAALWPSKSSWNLEPKESE